MTEYPKIQSIFKRDETTHRFIEGIYSLDEFDYLKNNEWVATEKIDGTNIRVIWNGETVEFRGKTDNAQIPKHLLVRLEEMFTVGSMIETFMEPVCLYGEGFGEKIQSGGKYMPDGHGVDLILFDVRMGDWWLTRDSLIDICAKLDIKLVPIKTSGSLRDMIQYTKDGFQSSFGDFIAEGIVCKPNVELRDRRGNRIITKMKYKDFIRKEV